MPDTEKPTYTTKEVMGLLGASRMTVTRLLDQGKLTGYKLTGGSTSPWRIYTDSVDTFLAQREEPQP